MMIKTGVWINREKLRKMLDKISFYYGIILMGLGIFSLIDGKYFLGIFCIVFAIPLYIIQFSLNKFEKDEWRKQIENGQKK